MPTDAKLTLGAVCGWTIAIGLGLLWGQEMVAMALGVTFIVMSVTIFSVILIAELVFWFVGCLKNIRRRWAPPSRWASSVCSWLL
jgi:hypothetical protein